MTWNSDPLMVAGGAMVGIDPVTGKMAGRDSVSQTGAVPGGVAPGAAPGAAPTTPGGKWIWKEGVKHLGPYVPENPMGFAAGPWMPPEGTDTSMYASNWRDIINSASEWLPDTPVPVAPTVPPTQTAADKARKDMAAAFTAYGADPTAYNTDIENRIAKIIAGIPPGTTDVNTFFPSDLGSKLIADLETGRRNKLTSEYESKVPKTFVPLTSDDAFIESIIGEQRKSADDIIKNMLARGQTGEEGATAARGELDRQAGLGRSRLTEIGTSLIGAEENTLGTERSKRATGIGSLKLTDPYDVGTQVTDLGKLATDFIATLGTGLKGALGPSPIFDTSGLQAIANKGQGIIPVGSGQSGTTAGMPETDDQKDEVLKTGNQTLF